MDEDPIDITLTSIGKISLNKGCKGYSLFSLLQTSAEMKAKDIDC
jgi:hypothetical protein